MQIVSIGENSHEMSKPVPGKILNKMYFKMSPAENFTQSATRYANRF